MNAPDPELAALDCAVGKLLGLDVTNVHDVCLRRMPYDPIAGYYDFVGFGPSTDWAQGGPIVERERIAVVADFSHPYDGPVVFRGWWAEMPSGLEAEGPTPLVAAMRAFVRSRS